MKSNQSLNTLLMDAWLEAIANGSDVIDPLDAVNGMLSSMTQAFGRGEFRNMPWLSQVAWDPRLRLSVFDYMPQYTGVDNEIQRFIWTFKDDNDEVVRGLATMVMALACTIYVELLRDIHGCAYVVAAPRSQAGSRNEPCEHVAKALGQIFHPWLAYIPNAFVRTASVPRRHERPRRKQLPVDDLMLTIAYTGKPRRRSHLGGRSLEDCAVLVVDDIVTSGRTFDACREVLQLAGFSTAVGLFLGRTTR